jgi:hypothetical protein
VSIETTDRCCDAFAKAVGDDIYTRGGALFSTPQKNQGEIVNDEDGTYAVPGCCGSCYVLIGMKFCPFCGAAL